MNIDDVYLDILGPYWAIGCSWVARSAAEKGLRLVLMRCRLSSSQCSTSETTRCQPEQRLYIYILASCWCSLPTNPPRICLIFRIVMWHVFLARFFNLNGWETSCLSRSSRSTGEEFCGCNFAPLGTVTPIDATHARGKESSLVCLLHSLEMSGIYALAGHTSQEKHQSITYKRFYFT